MVAVDQRPALFLNSDESLITDEATKEQTTTAQKRAAVAGGPR